MTRQLEQAQEDKQQKFAKAQLSALNGGMAAAVARAGGELGGFSARMDDYEVLLTIRAEFPAGRMIAFVGGDTLGSALVKVIREASQDRLKWREDKWGK